MCGYWVDRSITVGNSSTKWRFNIDCNVGHKLFGYYTNFANQGTHQIMVSNARIISWTKQTLNSLNAPTIHSGVDCVVRALPDNYIFVGALSSMRYEYNGTSFVNAVDLLNLHDDTREFCFPDNTKNTVFVGHDGGISKNLPNNKTYFSQINGNLALNSCYGLDIYEPD